MHPQVGVIVADCAVAGTDVGAGTAVAVCGVGVAVPLGEGMSLLVVRAADDGVRLAMGPR